MPDQIVEISNPGFQLSKSRGFLQVKNNTGQVQSIALDDILVVLVSHPACTLSTVLIDELTQRNVPLVISGRNFLPCSIILPLAKYQGQFKSMQAQITVSEPMRKRAWQQIVQRKILNQAEVLERIGEKSLPLKRLAKKVRSGDPENCEAQAARTYWQSLFGKHFRRDREDSGINTALNYTYTILRACVARGISGAGLHPTLSIHHKNPQNPFNLADDIMEPYRPIADMLTWLQKEKMSCELNAEGKAHLAAITNLPVPINQEWSPLSLAALRTCRSISSYYLEKGKILLPLLPEPINYAAIQ